MDFNLVSIHVNDMEASLSFYKDLLGLELQRFNDAGNGLLLAFLGKEEQPNVELIFDPAHKNNSYSGFSVGFSVSSLKEALNFFESKGFPAIRGPVSPSPFVSFAFIRDPNGVEVELLEYK